jgi:transposase-like protein
MREMEKYNKYDVLALEELYTKLAPWDKTLNFSVYTEGEENVCSCGSTEFVRNGFYYTNVGKFQRYRCSGCRAETHSKTNLLPKEKQKALLRRTGRTRE